MRHGLILNFTAHLAIGLSFFASCGSTKSVGYLPAKTAPSQELQLEIPKESWEPIFFREIDKRAKMAKLSSLRSALPNDDLEARFWIDDGPFGMDGIIIRRKSGAWSGIHIHGVSRDR